MAANYAMVGAGAIVIISHTLLSSGSKMGWYAILAALIFGGGFEIAAGTTIVGHGLPPNSIPLGLALYGYMAAWGSALIISYNPIFKI